MHVHLLQQLIRCPSLTPQDAGCLDIIEGYLKPLGFICHRLKFGEGDLQTENLYARFGEKSPNFCFAGHTDVVPVGDLKAWSVDPFKGDIKDGFLYGRGAVDMKGAIAAFIAASYDVIQKDNPSYSISLLLTSDEEGSAIYGTKKVIEWLKNKGESIDVCLVGEPTNPKTLGEKIKIGRRGSLNATISIQGKQGHVAYPQFSMNPIPPLLDYLGQLIKEPLDYGTDSFIASHLEITTVDVGNKVTNIIPCMAKAQFNIRFNPLHTGQSLKQYLQNLKDQIARKFLTALQWSLDIDISGEAFINHHKGLHDLMCEAIKSVTGFIPELDTSGGTSDARFLKDICSVIEFGLISDQAHQVDEHVSIKDLKTLKEIYACVLRNVKCYI